MQVFFIAAVAALVAVLVGTGGEFPLSDDWAFAHAARALCERGEIDALPWTGTPFVLQAAYGAALCSVFGFSFEILRLSSLLLGILGLAALYRLLVRAGAGGGAAALAVATVGLGPLWVHLSFTFMSDVPFVAAALVAALGYARGLERRRLDWLLVAALAAAAATLLRQQGLFLAAAAALVAATDRRQTPPARVGAALLAVLPPLLVLLGVQTWLASGAEMPVGVSNKIREALTVEPWRIVDAAVRATLTTALLASPVAFAVDRPLQRLRSPAGLAALLSAAAVAVAIYLRAGQAMPALTNIVYDSGVGPLTLRDSLFLGLPSPTTIGGPFELVLATTACLSAALLATTVGDVRKALTRTTVRFALAAAAALFAGSLLQSRYYFDRYVLAYLPFVVAVVTLALRPQRVPRVALVALALLATFSIAGTHDYMQWNRARWTALERLEIEGVEAKSIDGGFEYNAWRLAAELGTWPSDEDVKPGPHLDRKSWWWVVDDRWTLSMTELPATTRASSAVYSRWLPPGRGQVLILER